MEYSEYQINNKIKLLARRKGITMKFLAENINMTESGFYSALKNDSFKVKTLHDISTILDVEVNYFFKPLPDLKKLSKEIKDKKEEMLPLMINEAGVLKIINQSKGFTEEEAGLVSEIFNLMRIIDKKKIENKKITEENLLYLKIDKLNNNKIKNLVYTIKFLLLEILKFTKEVANIETFSSLNYIIKLYEDDFDKETIKKIKSLTKKFEIKFGKNKD